MSLIVEVYVGSHLDKSKRKLVAEGILHNVSDLRDISDYQGILIENGASHLGIEPHKEEIIILEHPRKQSVWSLVKKMVNHYG